MGMKEKYKMYLILILLSIAVHSVHSQQPSDYTRNSVYYAGQIMPTVPSTEQSSQDVLKELGVDLSNEGKPMFCLDQFFISYLVGFLRNSITEHIFSPSTVCSFV